MLLSPPSFGAESSNYIATPEIVQTNPYSPVGHVYLQEGDSKLQRWSSLIGIVTAIVGNILISFALNIQRYAHIRLHKERAARKHSWRSEHSSKSGYGTINEDNGTETPKSKAQDVLLRADSKDSAHCADLDNEEDHELTYLRSPYWWAGLILMSLGETGNFLAYGFAPASIVSPLGVVALISNCIIAPAMLKERFRYRDFWGVVVAVGGAVTVVLSAKPREEKLGSHEILEAVSRLDFEIYMVVTVVLIGVLMFASPRYGSKTILLDLGLVGLLGGYTALSTKAIASMFSTTLLRAFATPITYPLLVVLVVTAVLQIKYVNRALARFDSTQVIPVQFVMFTLSVIIGSAILYRDFEQATWQMLAKFVGGCLLTFFGVFLITSGRPGADEDSDEEFEDDEEETVGVAEEEPAFGEMAYQNRSSRTDSPRITRFGPVWDGDAANDDGRNGPRRLSRVSFVEPDDSRSRSRRKSSEASSPPSIRITESPFCEATPLMGSFSDQQLLRSVLRPGYSSTISTPNLPASDRPPSRGNTHPQMPRSSTQSNFHTHPSDQHGPTPPQAGRPATPSRAGSIARMLPGPYLSPLSSGLSAVVADTLRRDSEPFLRGRGFRRPRLRRSKSGSQRGLRRSESTADSHSPSPNRRATAHDINHSSEAESTQWPVVTRARSLSNTLGELLRGHWRSEDHQDEEAGPSQR